MRKRNLVLLVWGVLLLSVGHIYANGQNENSSNGQNVVVDIFQNKSEVAQQLESAAEIYMGKNPNVKINIETVQGNDYNTALKARMITGKGVDIMALGANDIANNYSEYLDDLSGESWVKKVPETLLGDGKLNGKVVGLPINIEGYGIVYNKAIFAAAGINPEKLITYDAIDKAFQDLQLMIDAGELREQFPYLEAVSEYAAKESWVIGLHTFNIALANEFSSSKEALDAQTIEIKYSDELKALYDLLINYTTSKDNIGQLLSVDYSTQIGGGLAIERVATVQQGNWIGPEVRSISPDVYKNLGFLPLPLIGVKEDSIAVGVPGYWCVNKNSTETEKEAAKDFMNWLYQSDEGKKIVVDELGYIPAFSNYDGIEISDPLSASIMGYVSKNKTMPWIFGGFPSGYEGQAASDLQKYIGGILTWDECLEALKSDWTALKK